MADHFSEEASLLNRPGSQGSHKLRKRVTLSGLDDDGPTQLTKRDSIKILLQDCRSGELSEKTFRFAVKAVLFGGLGGMHVGYDLGVIAGVILQLTTKFTLSTVQKELVTSIMTLGAMFGALFAGAICDKYGRRNTILFCSIVFIAAAGVTAAAQNVETYTVAGLSWVLGWPLP